MARISRKQLKQDRFVEEVGESVSYIASHRNRVIAGSVIVIALVIGVTSYGGYRRHQATEARRAFHSAMDLFHGVVEAEQRVGFVTFTTYAEKYRRTTEALEQVSKDFPSQPEGAAAEYYLALLEVEQDKFQEAQKRLEELLPRADEETAALARLTLGELSVRQGKLEDARKYYQYVIEHPTTLVPKQRAQLALARALVDSSPDEARALLDELVKQSGPVAVAAGATLRELEPL